MLLLDMDEQCARLAGLRFAALLRQHFPGFYLDHVMTRKAKHQELFGAASAFLSLAHTQLIALDHDRATFGFQFEIKDPARSFSYASCLAEWTCKKYMADGGLAWLNAPRVRVYGLGLETVLGNRYQLQHGGGVKQHSLALLIWYLLSNTRWSVMQSATLGTEVAKWVADDTYKQLILAALPIPRALSLPALCARLDEARPLGLGNLGTIIALLCRRTGNPYADTVLQEVREGDEATVPIDWRTTNFAAERANQKAAQQWATAYTRLATRLWGDPALAAAVRDAIVEAARQAPNRLGLATDTYDPRWLGHRLAEDA